MLAHARTPESTQEMQELSFGALLYGIMVATVQAANYTFGLRDAVAETSQALTKALARVDRYRKESEEHKQGLAQLREASQVRESQLNSWLREAESQAKAESGRASAAEARLELASEKLMAAEAQVEELSSRLQHVSDEALEGARAAAERIAAAEKAAVEAGLEKAGAVAYADEASARASEAKAKVEEAEAKVRRAEEETKTAAQRAVEEYKASPEFRQEVIEGSLEAYSQAFQACKERISVALGVDMSKLEGICPEGDEEEPESVEGRPEPEKP